MSLIKKFNINKKFLEQSMYVLFIILVSIIFVKVVFNFSDFTSGFSAFFSIARGVLTPFIYGFFIAYFANSVVRFFEQKIFRFIKSQKLKRTVSIVLTYFIVIGCLVWIISYLLPQVIKSVENFLSVFRPWLMNMWDTYEYIDLEEFFNSFNITMPADFNVTNIVNSIFSPIASAISNVPLLLTRIVSSAVTAAGSIVNIAFGIIASFYMLYDKEQFSEAISKILYAFMKKRHVDTIIDTAKSSNLIIQKFIVGKVLDSTIMGVIFFIICLILKLPYALLLGIVMGITNMIPYVGPFIGAIPIAIIVLITKPSMVIWILLIVLIQQQFDGLILGPKILGDSTGLRPIFVMFAITAGFAIGGIMGMFFGTPIFAVVRNLVMSIVDRKYGEKYKESGEPPEPEPIYCTEEDIP